jgi:predicted phage tail protein
MLFNAISGEMKMRVRLSRSRILAGAVVALTAGAISLLLLAGLTEASLGLALILGGAVLALGLGQMFGPRARRDRSEA